MPGLGVGMSVPHTTGRVTTGEPSAAQEDSPARRVVPLLEAQALSKSFGATAALTGVDLDVLAGERVAVIGENGAGKSTLMKILAGVTQPDSGSMRLFGEDYRPSSPAEAIAAGVAIVHQEPTFFPQLSVLENIFTGREVKNRVGNLRWGTMRAEGQVLFERLRLPTELLGRRMDSLSLGEQQLALIARALHQEARLLILDEPTSILTDPEVELLFTLMERHISGGGGLLYISHRMDEFEQVADRIVVLKDGRLVGRMNVGEAKEGELIRLMSGRELAMYERSGEPPARSETPVLTVRDLTLHGSYQDVSLDVHGGEVVGLYGLMGSGRTEIALTVFGELHADEGSMFIAGKPLRPRNPAAAVRQGIAYVPEDRKTLGLYPLLACGPNLSSALLPQLTRRGFIRRRAEREAVRDSYQALAIKSRSADESILNLSGGNQQKILLARWLATKPRLLLLDEPTRGIDVGTKAELHRLIRAQAHAGKAVIFISSELPELLGLADRVCVLYQGRVTAELPGGQASREAVLSATMGVPVDHH